MELSPSGQRMDREIENGRQMEKWGKPLEDLRPLSLAESYLGIW